MLTCSPVPLLMSPTPSPSAGAVAVAGLGISWLAKNLGILESNTQAEEVASTVSRGVGKGCVGYAAQGQEEEEEEEEEEREVASA